MYHMQEYTDIGKPYKFYQNYGAKVKRVAITTNPAWPSCPLRSSNIYWRGPVEDAARDIWKLILLFEDLECIVIQFRDIWSYETSRNKHGLLMTQYEPELQRLLREHAQWEKISSITLQGYLDEYKSLSDSSTHPSKLLRMPKIEHMHWGEFSYYAR